MYVVHCNPHTYSMCVSTACSTAIINAIFCFRHRASLARFGEDTVCRHAPVSDMYCPHHAASAGPRTRASWKRSPFQGSFKLEFTVCDSHVIPHLHPWTPSVTPVCYVSDRFPVSSLLCDPCDDGDCCDSMYWGFESGRRSLTEVSCA